MIGSCEMPAAWSFTYSCIDLPLSAKLRAKVTATTASTLGSSRARCRAKVRSSDPTAHPRTMGSLTIAISCNNLPFGVCAALTVCQVNRSNTESSSIRCMYKTATTSPATVQTKFVVGDVSSRALRTSRGACKFGAQANCSSSHKRGKSLNSANLILKGFRAKCCAMPWQYWPCSGNARMLFDTSSAGSSPAAAAAKARAAAVAASCRGKRPSMTSSGGTAPSSNASLDAGGARAHASARQMPCPTPATTRASARRSKRASKEARAVRLPMAPRELSRTTTSVSSFSAKVPAAELSLSHTVRVLSLPLHSLPHSTTNDRAKQMPRLSSVKRASPGCIGEPTSTTTADLGTPAAPSTIRQRSQASLSLATPAICKERPRAVNDFNRCHIFSRSRPSPHPSKMMHVGWCSNSWSGNAEQIACKSASSNASPLLSPPTSSRAACTISSSSSSSSSSSVDALLWNPGMAPPPASSNLSKSPRTFERAANQQSGRQHCSSARTPSGLMVKTPCRSMNPSFNSPDNISSRATRSGRRNAENSMRNGSPRLPPEVEPASTDRGQKYAMEIRTGNKMAPSKSVARRSPADACQALRCWSQASRWRLAAAEGIPNGGVASAYKLNKVGPKDALAAARESRSSKHLPPSTAPRYPRVAGSDSMYPRASQVRSTSAAGPRRSAAVSDNSWAEQDPDLFSHSRRGLNMCEEKLRRSGTACQPPTMPSILPGRAVAEGSTGHALRGATADGGWRCAVAPAAPPAVAAAAAAVVSSVEDAADDEASLASSGGGSAGAGIREPAVGAAAVAAGGLKATNVSHRALRRGTDPRAADPESGDSCGASWSFP
mmetsp:Transcript_11840/g.42335  ORF Transcript_11840/g.42335 Transcript_11840/m.42335 type:complete len:834 (+) Transcript_11840:926-3427(+)